MATADAQGIPGSTSNQPPTDTEFSLDGRATSELTSNIGETISSRTTRNYELDRIIRTVKDVVRCCVCLLLLRSIGLRPVISSTTEGIDPADFEGQPLPK